MYSIVVKYLAKFLHIRNYYLTTWCRVLVENIRSKVGHLVSKCRGFMDPEILLPCPSKPVLSCQPYTFNSD